MRNYIFKLLRKFTLHTLPFTFAFLVPASLSAQEIITSTPIHNRAYSPAKTLFVLKPAGNQTANIQDWTNAAGTVVTWVDKDGVLHATNGGGISSINGLSAFAQFFVTCASGLDFNIQDSVDTHSLCIPDASATARGLVTTGAQLFGGNKTFFGDTLMNGDLYVTGNLSTDNPIEITGSACGIAEASVGLWGFDPTTGLPCWSYDGSAPTTIAPPASGTTPASTGTGLLTGGAVVWTGLLNFSVSPATYLIGGTAYSSPLTAITLDAADAANPRIDVIAVDDTGSAIKITGTAATPPAAPSVDPTTQIGLTFVYVAALATTPSNFSTTNIYLENTEWTCTASANFNCASTNNPYAGTKDIEATAAVAGNNVTLVKPAAGTENLSAYTNLVFYVRSKASWPTPKSVIFSWLNGSTPVGSAVTLDDGLFGFSSSQTASYQQITIPESAFGTGGNLVTTLKIQVSGGGGSIGFYLDNIFLQAQTGSAQPVVNPYDVVSFFSGVPGASETLARVVFTRQVSFPIALAGSYASAGTAATASTVVSILKNGVQFGTCTFGVGATTCTFASTVGAVFAAGDVLTETAPVAPDATLADIAITLAGTR
jgi:hypothetical protein